MIPAIREKLAELGKADAERKDLRYQEKRRSVKLSYESGSAIKIKVDDGLITDGKRCDCLYFYATDNHKHHAFVVELKGIDYQHALEQLAATITHHHYQALLETAKANTRRTAVVIVSERARTNFPKKEKWENENHIRLRVIPQKEGQTYDLMDIIKNKDDEAP